MSKTQQLGRGRFQRTTHFGSKFAYGDDDTTQPDPSGVAGKGRAGAGAVTEAGAQATCPKAWLASKPVKSGAYSQRFEQPSAQLTSKPVESGAYSQRFEQPSAQLTSKPVESGANSTA
ncbi:hypothetical protein VYU27_006497 [Nannochloropsis oceanica]